MQIGGAFVLLVLGDDHEFPLRLCRRFVLGAFFGRIGRFALGYSAGRLGQRHHWGWLVVLDVTRHGCGEEGLSLVVTNARKGIEQRGEVRARRR